MDERHNRDAFIQLLNDVKQGHLDVVVVHDFGQLGNNKMAIFRALEPLLDSKAELIIPGIGRVTGQTPVPPASQIDFV